MVLFSSNTITHRKRTFEVALKHSTQVVYSRGIYSKIFKEAKISELYFISLLLKVVLVNLKLFIVHSKCINE